MQRLIALNGQAFEHLPNLIATILVHNYCIDKILYGSDFRKFASQAITKSCGFKEIESQEVVCEKYADYSHFFTLPLDVCLMNGTTAIDDNNFVIGDLKDVEVEGIDFSKNKRIEYLPYKIHLQFPNLMFYEASSCSIKQVTKQNFEQLIRLKRIDLSFNKIQKLSGNTFNGLANLLRIFLCEFKFHYLDF